VSATAPGRITERATMRPDVGSMRTTVVFANSGEGG
jgi:hypothetical protein